MGNGDEYYDLPDDEDEVPTEFAEEPENNGRDSAVELPDDEDA